MKLRHSFAICILSILLSPIVLYGQLTIDREVIGSAGFQEMENVPLHSTWTAGEVKVANHGKGLLYISEGFQQSLDEGIAVFTDLPYQDLEIQVFPNPTSDRIMIRTDFHRGIGTHADISYRVYNVRGEVLLLEKKNIMADESVIDLSHLVSGVYYLVLMDSSGSHIKNFRIIKL